MMNKYEEKLFDYLCKCKENEGITLFVAFVEILGDLKNLADIKGINFEMALKASQTSNDVDYYKIMEEYNNF